MKAKVVIPGYACEINLYEDYPLAFAWSSKELEKLLECLEDDGLIEYEEDQVYGIYNDVDPEPIKFKNRKRRSKYRMSIHSDVTQCSFHITRKGWAASTIAKSDNKGFIAIDFNDSMDSTIKTIEDSIIETGYKPMVIKDKDYPETVMEKAFGEIRKSMFIIVDITNLRPSVFYEAGFARGIGKPVFYVCSQSFRDELKEGNKELEFYSKQYKIRFYKNFLDLRKDVITIIEANFPIINKE